MTNNNNIQTVNGELPDEWELTTLGNIADITSSKRIFASDYFPDGVPFFRGKEIIEKNAGDEVTTELFISESKYQEIKDRYGVPLENDILLTSVGTLGVPYRVTGGDRFYFKDGNITWFRDLENTTSQFLFHWLNSDFGKRKLIEKSIGSTQQALTIIALKSVEIALPPLDERLQIASILSSLDDKIELNRKMNKTMEEMGKALFKRWFVDFEFPNENDEPYKSSGGEMVESELGKIPIGWKVKSLLELANYINGKAFKNEDFSDEGLPIIKIAELKNRVSNSTSKTDHEFDEKYLLTNRDILFSWSGSPDTSIDCFIWFSGRGWLNQHIFKVVPQNGLSKGFVYFLLKYFMARFISIAHNKKTTGLGHVTVSDLKRIKIALPSEINFYKLLEDLFENIYENLREIQTLEEARDSLLPRLMSGKIRVN